jgi:SSS family solute:Na+ symporter
MAAYGPCTGSLQPLYWVAPSRDGVRGVFLLPFYYGSGLAGAEYLMLRFDEKTRAFNAISFAT